MMSVILADFVRDLAQGIRDADRHQPTYGSYQPGIGPHSENETMRLALRQMAHSKPSNYAGRYESQVRYINQPRSKCDVCIGAAPEWDLAIEVKMLRFMGDNGKPNDNILMHILSPYPSHRSAVTDCEKLRSSGIQGTKGIVIFGYDYPDIQMDLAIDAFELLARSRVAVGPRQTASFEQLIHPIHRTGRVFGWEVL